MSLEEDILIDHFLKNELTEIEKKAVFVRMNSDAIFKEKVLFEQQLFDTLDEKSWSFAKNIDNSEAKEYENLFKSDAIKDIKNSIAKANDNFKKKKTSGFKKWQIFSSAAVIALLISVYFLLPKNETPQEIYASHINMSELPSIVNRGNEISFKKLAKAQQFFENNQHSKSAIIFSEALKNNSNNSSIYIYLAISQMELNQFEKAEKTLDSLKTSNLVDAQKSYWYKSLLYIKANQIEKAKKTLATIIDHSYFNHLKAKKLLDQINKL